MWKTSDFVVDTNNLSLVSSLRVSLAARKTEDLWRLETGEREREGECLFISDWKTSDIVVF